jgi:hypothetical protein
MADEQESASAERVEPEPAVVSDGKAAAEAEIEPGKSPDEEPRIESDESAARQGESVEIGCPVGMGLTDLRCGRKLHFAPGGPDERPVCLMHSKDPLKQSGLLYEAFWLEFERILEDAGEKEAHFERFVFPHLNLSKRKFQAICRFADAIFTQEAMFGDAVFAQGASFFNATFMQDAEFWNATFTLDASFRGATFAQDADFADAIFTQDAHFDSAAFTQDAHFWKATFLHLADFSRAIFMRDTNFGDATFTLATDFSYATFTQDANFNQATFTQDAVFRSAAFMQNANFNRATFARSAYFNGATFTLAARFVETRFQGTASWWGSRFLDRAEFRRTIFDPQTAGHESALFALAAFNKPGEIVFDEVDLSRVFFHDCDVSQVWFTSSARWANREDNRGLAVYEETIPLKEYRALELKRDGQRDYDAVAQIYQQLKKNYDSRLDYWTANKFHYGEMEMKRLAVPTSGPLLGLRRCLHRRLSLVALYRYASDYGNSYGKPVLWLLGILALFAALFPFPGVGLKRQGASQAESYASVWNVQKGYAENLWTEARLAGKGAITAVDTATFQKSAEYAPAYPWGRVLAIFETLLTSTLFGLFLLAIRRQFRR